MNYPEKGRRKFGTEGLDKSVIVKKPAESRVQAVTDRGLEIYHLIIQSHCFPLETS